MRDEVFGSVLRALRLRRGWRQVDVAIRAGVSQATVSLIESGHLDLFTMETIRRVARGLGVSVELAGRWRGPELARLLDADHAALQAHWKHRLERLGWQVDPEVSFSIYGERGRYDLFAYRPVDRSLFVPELKSALTDIQGTLGPLDVKSRLATQVASERELTVDHVVPGLIMIDGTTNRRRIAAHAPLFAAFDLRGRAALAWLARPEAPRPMRGVLLFTSLPPINGIDRRQAGRRRVRTAGPAPSVQTAVETLAQRW
jgi:transcriptional regulator with XRE-family HTH domain